MRKIFVRKLTRVSSHSYTITVPKELIKTFKWRERQKLELVWGGRKHELTLRDWNPQRKRTR